MLKNQILAQQNQLPINPLQKILVKSRVWENVQYVVLMYMNTKKGSSVKTTKSVDMESVMKFNVLNSLTRNLKKQW